MFNWTWVILFFAVQFHITAMVYTVFIHRGIMHGQFTFSPVLSHAFRLWMWLVGWGGKDWVKYIISQHRKHHITSDTEQDPHSPYFFPVKQIIFNSRNNTPGQAYYMSESETKIYSAGSYQFNDWPEQKIYSQFGSKGIIFLTIVCFVLFGLIGAIVELILSFVTIRYLIPFLGAWVYHKVGYSNPANNDHSRNVFPIGILLCGEELHANHHSNPGNTNFAQKWYEFDLGYCYSKLFQVLGLLKST
jgi:stearoyl-CoA desaturase (delta-9 desaturase)